MHPWFVPSNNPVKCIFSSSAYLKTRCKDRHIKFIFFLSFSSMGTHLAHIFRNFKRSCIMLYAKLCEHPSAVATLSVVILMSAWINSPPTAQLLLSQTQEGELVGHHLRLSNVLERIFRPSCEPLSQPLPHLKFKLISSAKCLPPRLNPTRQTLPTVNRKHYECPLHWVLLPAKKVQENDALW
jgi:hypothetical protein